MRMTKMRNGCSIALAALLVQATPGIAQEAWEVPRTSAGHPVLQGYWTSTTVVPFERPRELGERAFYTQEEAQARLKAALVTTETERGTTEDVHYQFEDYGL